MPIVHGCAKPGCLELIAIGERWCDAHRKKHYETQDAKRGSASARLYGSRWQRARQLYLSDHPLCADPYKQHGVRLVVAVVLDHIKPHGGDLELFWDQGNWQGLCQACNARKTAADHGWSREGQGGGLDV